jgi:hypothetical protein
MTTLPPYCVNRRSWILVDRQRQVLFSGQNLHKHLASSPKCDEAIVSHGVSKDSQISSFAPITSPVSDNLDDAYVEVNGERFTSLLEFVTLSIRSSPCSNYSNVECDIGLCIMCPRFRGTPVYFSEPVGHCRN